MLSYFIPYKWILVLCIVCCSTLRSVPCTMQMLESRDSNNPPQRHRQSRFCVFNSFDFSTSLYPTFIRLAIQHRHFAYIFVLKSSYETVQVNHYSEMVWAADRKRARVNKTATIPTTNKYTVNVCVFYLSPLL